MSQNVNEIESEQKFPGQRLGLPEQGRGSVATWGQRSTALVLDWAIAMALATAITWGAALTSLGPERFATLIVFFLQKSLFTALTGSSPGQLIVGIGVTRIDRTALPWWVAVVRTLMICLVVPAAILGEDRRSLNDIMLRTVVVRRR